MFIRNRCIDVLSVAWLAIGVVVFMLGWCQWYVSLPLTLLMIGLTVKMYVKADAYESTGISVSKLLLALAIVVVMMAVCGIGGYVVQPNDHFGRNAIFTDTWRYSWPVYDKSEGLYQCYYLGFWMVPAVVGKLFHSLDIGFLAQLVWLSIGFLLLYLQICRYMGKARLSYLFFFYFFSGLKLLECIAFLPLMGDGFLKETVNVLATNGSPQVFHAGPMVQLLYDPFNQTIPLFLGMMVMINNTRSAMIPFIYALLLLYAPFPFAGLAPMVLYWWIRNTKDRPGNFCINIFNIENITALLVIALVALYLLSNINGSNKGLRPSSHWGEDIYGFVVYMMFEFLIYFVIAYKVCQDKALLWVGLISVSVMGWFQIGLHNDFCFRSNMPFIFLLCLLVMRRFYSALAGRRVRALVLACYMIGGLPAQIHPGLRLLSSYFVYTHQSQTVLNQYQNIMDVRKMYIMQQTKTRNDDLKSTFHCGSWGWMCDSFKGRPDSFFFQFIAKPVE